MPAELGPQSLRDGPDEQDPGAGRVEYDSAGEQMPGRAAAAGSVGVVGEKAQDEPAAVGGAVSWRYVARSAAGATAAIASDSRTISETSRSQEHGQGVTHLVNLSKARALVETLCVVVRLNADSTTSAPAGGLDEHLEQAGPDPTRVHATLGTPAALPQASGLRSAGRTSLEPADPVALALEQRTAADEPQQRYQPEAARACCRPG